MGFPAPEPWGPADLGVLSLDCVMWDTLTPSIGSSFPRTPGRTCPWQTFSGWQLEISKATFYSPQARSSTAPAEVNLRSPRQIPQQPHQVGLDCKLRRGNQGWGRWASLRYAAWLVGAESRFALRCLELACGEAWPGGCSGNGDSHVPAPHMTSSLGSEATHRSLRQQNSFLCVPTKSNRSLLETTNQTPNNSCFSQPGSPREAGF